MQAETILICLYQMALMFQPTDKTSSAELKIILVLPSLDGQFQNFVVLLPRKCYLRGVTTPALSGVMGLSH